MPQDHFVFEPKAIGGGVTRGTLAHTEGVTDLDLSVLGGTALDNCWVVNQFNAHVSIEIFIGMDKPGVGNLPEPTPPDLLA